MALPEKGKFAVFNRTHYENVLVTRVHPEYILFETLPGIEKVEDITPQFWENRMEQMVNFEKHISLNGTKVFEFYFDLKFKFPNLHKQSIYHYLDVAPDFHILW